MINIRELAIEEMLTVSAIYNINNTMAADENVFDSVFHTCLKFSQRKCTYLYEKKTHTLDKNTLKFNNLRFVHCQRMNFIGKLRLYA